MSTTYEVIAGDTFDTVSRKVYGVDGRGLLIKGANSGATEPLTAGMALTIPALPDAPTNITQPGLSDSVNEAAILIDGERFRFWDSVSIIRSIDTLSSIEFSAPFDDADAAQRKAFRPFTYPDVEFTVGGESLFLGTMLGPTPEVDPLTKFVTMGGYSKPGVMGDCTLPAGVYPQNQFDNSTLEDIARAVAGFFGINVAFEAEAGAAFDREACDPDKKPLQFLASLAKQRNLVIGDDAAGNLVFRQSAPAGVPVAVLKQGVSPVVSVAAFFDHQQYYSHITGIEPVAVGATGSQHTIVNTKLPGVLRPHTFIVNDAKGGDMQPATAAKLGRMFGNMATYSVTVDTWRDAKGRLWEPNTTVQLLAPGAMVYNGYNFIIKTAVLERDAKGESASLDLVMPGAFSGQIPDSFPWDD